MEKTIILLFISLLLSLNTQCQRYEALPQEADFLDMDPDSILEENAVILANATCGLHHKEYFCRLVEHADGPQTYGRPSRENERVFTYGQEPKSYRDSSGQWIQCGYCDDNDPKLRHPIEYVLRGESNLWWQSPSLAEGLKYHAVTITMDFMQVYQIVYVLLRMGDSPRPANWILERSVDGKIYKPWVFFAKTEYDCKRLYQPLIEEKLTITNGPRPWHLGDDEVYCTTFYSQPQALQSGEIIVTLTLDRESTVSMPSGTERPISAKLIDFLSARFVRLRFQQLQTLSGDWMAMPNQLDSSVYNRYYYSIRTIKVGGKCVCNSHANRCEQRTIDGVPRAMCVCQHNTCGNNCEKCCPLYNQKPWRPGHICEECNCNQKADECIYNQTVANLRLSMRRDGIFEGGGVCVNCREDTTGINCEKCKVGFYRPINVRPDSPFPCIPCQCDTYGSTGDCVTNDAEVPKRYPGDCVCKTGFAGQKCDQCAEGYQRSKIDPHQCIPCTCDIRGSHRGGGYQCEPPCNCKINVDPDSHCSACQPGHFNLDISNPDGCQACYCSGLTNKCKGVSESTTMVLQSKGMLGPISNLRGWKIIVPSLLSPESGFTTAITGSSDDLEKGLILYGETRTIETWFSSVSPTPVTRGYYWSAPEIYLGNQITAYRSILTIILRFTSPTLLTYRGSSFTDSMSRQPSTSMAVSDHINYLWLHEPDVVLEGNGYRLAFMLPSTYRENHLILKIPIHESSFRVLVEPFTSIRLDRLPINWIQGVASTSPDEQTGDKVGRPANVADLMNVLSNLTRLLIKSKFISDQTTTELLTVSLGRAVSDASKTVPSIEECECPTGHTGTSCESCAFGYWRDSQRKQMQERNQTIQGMWRLMKFKQEPICVPCECHGHSSECDKNTGTCINCQHNTAGDKCDVCAPGFYGDPRSGSPTACRPCECPNLDYQMTSTCMAHDVNAEYEPKPYVCMDCTANTRGRYCDLCAEMYYGDPIKGISCRPCECGSAAVGCNTTNGACICGFNTAGAHCEACAEGTHGDPLSGQPCRPCNCHPKGSVSPTCRLGDGQCTCKPAYEGVSCDRCISGRGNVEAGCPLCQCDPTGTMPEARRSCDTTTGQCACKPGVGGTLDCSQCKPGYYDLGPNGCKECQCTPRALDRICDPITGKCNCGQNVMGDTCDQCMHGHYWNLTGSNCLPCACGIGTALTKTLAQIADCDMITGQCKCAAHVVGRDCSECEPGYFGVSSSGCKLCPKCPNGQVCDQISGKCICPPNTEGDQCDRCSSGSWDYNPLMGCKYCECSAVGSELETMNKCDLVTGQCKCKSGYAGRACDQCDFGYYGYPLCKRCDCDMSGTAVVNITQIDTIMPCNQTDGRCLCKTNVQGDRCDQCKPGTFGLHIDYPLGCYSCFCFPAGSQPKCSLLTGLRSVPGKVVGVEIISTDDPRYPGGPLIDLKLGLMTSELSDINIGMSQFNWRFSVHRPTYMEIPELTGSLMRNYGSLIIAVSTECLPTGDCKLITSSKFGQKSTKPTPTLNDLAGKLVVRRPDRIDARMTALNNQLELEYQPSDDSQNSITDGFRQIWLREQDWVLTRVSGLDTRVRPNRNELMLALFNVTSFSVRLFMPEAKPKLVSVKYKVYHAQSEITTLSGTEIRSTEKCECPPTASGDHCEIASPGFYFPSINLRPGPNILPPEETMDLNITKPNVIWEGGAQKCNCHGMSSKCDSITGVCENCTGNTEGPDCGTCISGFMGDPKAGETCVKCQCPTDQTDYAITCMASTERPYIPHKCVCKPGYTGLRCEECAWGYFGDPTSSTACQPCDCDLSGSKSSTCNRETGECDCWPGIGGRRCDQCEPDHVVDAGQCVDCRGACTGELLIKADETKSQIDNLNVTSLAYRGLSRTMEQAKRVNERFTKQREQQESELIIRTKQLSKQIVELYEQFSLINGNYEALNVVNCDNRNQLIEMIKQSQDLHTNIRSWIERLEKQEFGKSLSSVELNQWREQARLLNTKLNSINLNLPENWLKKIIASAQEILKEIENLNRLIKPGKVIYELDLLNIYQDYQQFLTDFHVNQLYRVGNGTRLAKKELELAQKKANQLVDAVKTTTDINTIISIQEKFKLLDKEILDLENLQRQDPKDLIDNAKSVFRSLNQIQLADHNTLVIPQPIENDIIKPLVRETQFIQDLLVTSKLINQTLLARESFQTIINNMEKAENSTEMAERALSLSLSEQDKTWQETLKNVTVNSDLVEHSLNQQSDILNKHNDTLSVANELLGKIDHTLKTLKQTTTGNVDKAQTITIQVDTVKQYLKDTDPLVHNASESIETHRKRYENLQERLQNMEKRYAEIQGTAHSIVDKANISQITFRNILEETETVAKRIDSKILELRRLTEKARSMLDVNYGALAHDPVPLQFEQGCIYTLVPYSLTKSRAFDIEFWFNLDSLPKQSSSNSVLMVGRRAFPGHTQMFAFTIEGPDSRLRFSWNTPNGHLEIGSIQEKVWYQVRVTSVGGETKMMLMERPFQEHLPAKPKIQEVVTLNGSENQEAVLIMDKLMELRIGGALPTGIKSANPETWGDNGAEEFWSNILGMEPLKFCLFNMRLSGIPTSLINFAQASSECSQPKKLQCQVVNYRPYVRNGYIWEIQGKLNKLTNQPRPSQLPDPPRTLTRMFFYDFNGAGGYARLKSFDKLEFCKNEINFQLTPITENKQTNMTAMTFFNYNKDFGITVQLINGQLDVTQWYGGELYNLEQPLVKTDEEENIRRRRFNLFSSRSRLKRQISVDNRIPEKMRFDWSVTDHTVKLIRLDKLVTNDCNDEVVLYLGAIPPDHYHLRKRMHDLGFTLNPFVGRIGFTTEQLGYDGDFYLDDYLLYPVGVFGDTQFTDFRQLGEIRSVTNFRPNSQYCLQLTPNERSSAPELRKPMNYSPFEPGISMTIRFDPTQTKLQETDIIKIQLVTAEWIRIFLTEDHHLGIVIPGVNKPLITKASLSDKALNGPDQSLFNLRLMESLNLSEVLPTYNSLYKFGIPNKVNSMKVSPTEIEMVITVCFDSSNNEQLIVLFDQLIVQTWSIPKHSNTGNPQQIIIGPYMKSNYPLTISHLMIGRRLVDFSTDLVAGDSNYGLNIGMCSGALYPRYIEHQDLIENTITKMQGLDLETSPNGRRLIFVPYNEFAENHTFRRLGLDSSKDRRLPKRSDCTENSDNTAWFDQNPESYWQINNLGTLVQDSKQPFEFTIGFRAQLTDSLGSDNVLMNSQNEEIYSLLTAFNFGPNQGNLYIILSKNQIFVHADSKNFLWTSPILTLTDTTWHQLKLILPKNSGSNDQNGPGVENGIQIIYDHRRFWLPPITIDGLPTVGFIGGVPKMPNLKLGPNEVSIIYGLFGCIDQLVVNDIILEPRTSGRPLCYDCFSLGSSTTHIPSGIQDYILNHPIQLHIPDHLLEANYEYMTFDFSFFYDHLKIKQASLFVLTFVGNSDKNDGKIHLWLFLTNNEVKMGYISNDQETPDLNHGVSLSNLAYNQNMWHFIRLHIYFIQNEAIFILKSQTSTSQPLVSDTSVDRLSSISFGQNQHLMKDKMITAAYDYDGQIFHGCIRNLRLTTDSTSENLQFPENIPKFLYGICHTSLVW